MAFKASNIIPEQGYTQAKRSVLNLQRYCQAKSSNLDIGIDANDLLGILATLKQASIDLTAFKAITGIAAYAIEQEVDVSYDVVAEFNALIAFVDAAVTNISTAIPEAGGFLQIISLTGSDVVWREFTPAQLSVVKTNLDAISNAVI